jgi:predicted MFS family arabinose efflux permease
LIFSIKQCGTPGGGMLAGAILPPLIILYDWRMALYVVPAFGLAALLLAAVCGVGPREPRRAGGRVVFADIAGSLRFVWSDRIQRGHALAAMAFAGSQLAMAAYLVVYLWRVIGLAPEMAGLIYATVHVSGIAARIALGFAAGRWLATRTMLPLLAFVMAAGLAAVALSTNAWPPAVFFLIAVVIGIGGNGWVGLFLSEITLLAPDDRAADATSGGQFFMYGGIVAGPSLAGAIVAATGSYPVLFLVFAAFSCAAGLWLYRVTR